jgi:flagellar hook protein FlgE
VLRSLFTGISGLRAHQQMLDVTSNNIANVNTNGFKSSETTFEDTLSQTLEGAAQPTATNGGTNAVQVGLGVKLAGTNANFTQGSTQTTGRDEDLMINGDGFFVVSNNGTQEYTRAGSFTTDSAGHMTLPDGSILQSAAGGDLDLSALVNGLESGTYVSWSISPSGDVNAVQAGTGTTDTLGTVAMATFVNPGGLARVGDTEFQSTANSGPADVGAPQTGSRGSLTQGALEMSNVDLSTELTNLIISERGFQANSKVITTSDEVLQTLVNLKS